MEHFAATDAILITPATVVPGRFGGHEDDTSMIEYGQTLSKVAQQVNSQRTERGEKGFVQVVDMNKAFRNAAEKIDGGLPSLHVDDGLHISSKGYQVSHTFTKKKDLQSNICIARAALSKVVFEVSQLILS